jgi:predicted nucleotidyltransferase
VSLTLNDGGVAWTAVKPRQSLWFSTYLLPVIGEEAIAEVARRLGSAFAKPATVLLFGSAVRAEGEKARDLDLLVIEEDLEDRWAERRRLRNEASVEGPRLDVPAAKQLLSDLEVWAEREVSS